jgi:hypothetical protein
VPIFQAEWSRHRNLVVPSGSHHKAEKERNGHIAEYASKFNGIMAKLHWSDEANKREPSDINLQPLFTLLITNLK